MKYLIFEKKAVEKLVNEHTLQSDDFENGKDFVDLIRGNRNNFSVSGISYKIENDKDGVIFCGRKPQKIFLFIDLEQSGLLEKTSDIELLIVLQKVFRFALRFWTNQTYTRSEMMFKERTVIFPFPYSKSSNYRIVINRNTNVDRLRKRDVQKCLLAYKYGDEGQPSSADECPELINFRVGGEAFLAFLSDARKNLIEEEREEININKCSIHIYGAPNMIQSPEFKYLQYENQLCNLTQSQKNVVLCTDLKSPIRIEGPAGTGKTASMILRAIRLYKEAKRKEEEFSIIYIVHSKSTELAINEVFFSMLDTGWNDIKKEQFIKVTTLQDYCVELIKLEKTQIIDNDASESKQYQLFSIQEAFISVQGNIFNTYRPLMSDEAINFFEKEELNKVVIMLQYEFGIRIKGIAEGDIDRYKQLPKLRNGMPLNNDGDRDFVFRIYKIYQESLEILGVYDTDDIIIEATGRLNGPLWRRTRLKEGFDYIFVDEMHLFNLNEQQIFHLLSKDYLQKKIPICFALDYAQTIGERDDFSENYIEKTISQGQVINTELTTVFRNSPQIAELCASIISSGALLFDSFVNPYKYCTSNFVGAIEQKCSVPRLIMYENDDLMKASIESIIREEINKFKCVQSEIAVIFFDSFMLEQNFLTAIGRYKVTYINSRNGAPAKIDTNKVICTIPEEVSGLEFKCCILVGVDDGRVPPKGISDISSNFLKYGALNKLYLTCSRAQYDVVMLGTKVRGISSLLEHTIADKVLLLEDR